MSVHVELEIGGSLKDNIGTYFCNENIHVLKGHACEDWYWSRNTILHRLRVTLNNS